MPTITADHDVEGHLAVLLKTLHSSIWIEFWSNVSCDIESFERLGIAEDASDEEIWQLCQERGIILITGNLNALSEDSLEQTIRRRLEPLHLPVFTISDPSRMMRDRDYLERVAAGLIDNLDRLNTFGRGAYVLTIECS